MDWDPNVNVQSPHLKFSTLTAVYCVVKNELAAVVLLLIALLLLLVLALALFNFHFVPLCPVRIC